MGRPPPGPAAGAVRRREFNTLAGGSVRLRWHGACSSRRSMKKTKHTSGGEQQRPHPDDEAMHQRLLQWFVPGAGDAGAGAGR